MVENQKPMSRVILGRRASRNADVAIATIHPMPNHQVAFNAICDVLHEFFRDQARVGYHFIQPCPFGQAYVKFNYFHHRDQLCSEHGCHSHLFKYDFGDSYTTQSWD
jgi:hypothetical protein